MGNWPSVRDGSRRGGPRAPGLDPLEDRQLLSGMGPEAAPSPAARPAYFEVAAITPGIMQARALRSPGGPLADPSPAMFSFARFAPAAEARFVRPPGGPADDSSGGETFLYRTAAATLPPFAEGGMAFSGIGGAMAIASTDGPRWALGPPDPSRGPMAALLVDTSRGDRFFSLAGRAPDGVRGPVDPPPDRDRGFGLIGLAMTAAPGASPHAASPVAPPAPPGGAFPETLLSYGPAATPSAAMPPRDGAIAINGMSGGNSASAPLQLAAISGDPAEEAPGIPADAAPRHRGAGAVPPASRGGRPIEAPSPVGEGPVTSFSPFGLSPALEKSVARLLDGIEGFGLPSPRGGGFPAVLLPVAAAIGAFKAWRKFRGRGPAPATPQSRGGRSPLGCRLS